MDIPHPSNPGEKNSNKTLCASTSEPIHDRKMFN
jgi:hypothetical protein